MKSKTVEYLVVKFVKIYNKQKMYKLNLILVLENYYF